MKLRNFEAVILKIGETRNSKAGILKFVCSEHNCARIINLERAISLILLLEGGYGIVNVTQPS